MGANDFDKILKDGVKMWTPKKGDNRIRICPPTWPKPEHYGYDIWVHYGVGPDRGTYLDLDKMKGEPDPVTEEWAELKRTGAADEDELKQMQSKRRVLVYLVDRDNESEGVQAWAMPWTLDKDISVLSVDKSTGAVLLIDDPEEGYDVEFTKEGEKDRTKYVGIAIARRSSRLGKTEWLDYCVDNPLPDQLQFFSYDEIAKVFGGRGAHRERSRDDDRGRDDRGSSRDDSGDSDRGERGRDDRSRDRERDEDRSPRSRGREVEDRAPAGPTWAAVQAMTGAELDALCAEHPDLAKIKPNEADSDKQLADWICEDLGLKEEVATTTRRRAEPPPADADDRLARMREERSRR